MFAAIRNWLGSLSYGQTARKGTWDSGWTVAVENSAIIARNPRGETTTVPFDAIAGVVVQTTSDGPWFSDVWWWLFDSDTKPLGIFPGEAEGASQAVDILTGFEGFDHRTMIEAMGCTNDRIFAVWQREGLLKELLATFQAGGR